MLLLTCKVKSEMMAGEVLDGLGGEVCGGEGTRSHCGALAMVMTAAVCSASVGGVALHCIAPGSRRTR